MKKYNLYNMYNEIVDYLRSETSEDRELSAEDFSGYIEKAFNIALRDEYINTMTEMANKVYTGIDDRYQKSVKELQKVNIYI